MKIKNNKYIKIHINFFRNYVNSESELLFISNFFAFISFLKMNYCKQTIKIFLTQYNLNNLDKQVLNHFLNLNKQKNNFIFNVLNFYEINQNYEEIKIISELFCKLYNLHTTTKKIKYFYAKDYCEEDYKISAQNYMEITSLLGKFNQCIKELLNKNYASTIKFAKEIFLRVKLYE